MIAFYNQQVGEVLMITVAPVGGAACDFEKKGKIARVFRRDTGETVGWNFFGVKRQEQGPVKLVEDEVNELNDHLLAAGFSEVLSYDCRPKLVVAEIKSHKPHPDSDHLQVCKVDIGFADPVQIVAGAPNVREGLKTVAATPEALMPDGTIIWPGELRGVASYGMLCSPRELALPGAPQERGIIELTTGTVGRAFDAATMWP